MYQKTHALMQRGIDFLGTEHAVLCGAMSWVSERNLVSAISNAGGFGVIACGAMTPELLDAEITATKALTAKPFGVNLITMHPLLFDLIEVCARTRSATWCWPAASRRKAVSKRSRPLEPRRWSLPPRWRWPSACCAAGPMRW